MMTWQRFFAFIVDYCLACWFFHHVAEKKSAHPGWRFLGHTLLLGIFCLYLNGSGGLLESSAVRFVVRALFYALFLLFAKKIAPGPTIYNTCYCAVVCTICQNVFLTPFFGPIYIGHMPGSFPITPQTTQNMIFMYLFTLASYSMVIHSAPLKHNKKISGAQAASLTIVAVCSLYIKDTLIVMSAQNGEHLIEFTIYTIILQIFLLLFLVLFERYQYGQREKLIIQAQDIANRYMLKSMKGQEENHAALRRIRHDIKNHMLAIKRLAEQGSYASISNYIENMIGEISNSDIRVETGNLLLNALLADKLNEAIKMKIDATAIIDFRKGSFIEDMDLCTIIGNAMDNAIEACEKIPNINQRFIQIRGGCSANCIFVTIENSFWGTLTMDDKFPLTTKKDLINHGYGLGNIKRTLKKYDGTISLNINSEHHFVLTIMIPLPSGL